MKYQKGVEMISKKFKVLVEIDGLDYVFSAFAFKAHVHKFKADMRNKGEMISAEQICENIAQKVHVTVDSIRNWMYGKNGPSDLESVKAIADYMNIDYMELLKVQEDTKMSEKSTVTNTVINAEKTKDVIRVIYQKMSAFMDAAVEELCFDKDEAIYWTYDGVYKDLVRTLHQSMLDIPMPIYVQLKDVIENRLALYIYGLDHGLASIWDLDDFTEFCKTTTVFPEVFYMEREAEEFYEKMRDILKDYLVD